MRNYQAAAVHLKTISPIHIRGKNIDFGEGMLRLNRRDDTLGNDYAYLIDNDVLCEWLYALDPDNLRYVNAYSSYFTDANNRDYSLERFLEQNGILSQLEEIDKDSEWFRIFKGRAFIGDGNYFIQNRRRDYYIPGSTLKGAIRTAVLYSIAKELKNNNPDWFCKNIVSPVLKKIKKFLSKSGHEQEDVKRVFAKEIEEEIFKSFAPIDEDLKGKKGEPNQEQKDLSRIFRITDITLDRENIKEEEVIVMTLKNGNEPYRKHKFQGVECYESNETLTGRITIDLDLMERFKMGFDASGLPFTFPFDLINPISSVENMLKEFADDQWQEELKYYNDIGTLIDNELDDSFTNKPYSCLEYGTVSSNFAGTAFFTNRRNGVFIRDDSRERDRSKHEILHYNKDIVRTVNQNVLYQQGSNSRGSYAQSIFSYKFGGPQNSTASISLSNNFADPIKDFYSNNQNSANIRFGWGTQLLGMTIDILFDPILKKLIRDEVLLKQIRNLPAPKSRRFVLRKNRAYKPLGWCKMTFQKES